MFRSKHLALPLCTTLLLLSQKIFAEELPASPPRLLMESGIPVPLQLAETISSARAHKGERLKFVVTRDVEVGGFTVIRAGAPAEGSVVAVKGKRPFGIGGDIRLKLDSVQLTSGQRVELAAIREFKGRSHTIRMAMEIAVAAAFYAPAAPAFLLTRGRDSFVLKGTELTAYTSTPSSLAVADLPLAVSNTSALNQMLALLPPRALNGEGREGDMLNLLFVAPEDELQATFARAGWLRVEKSKPQIVWHLLCQRRHYTKLPMTKLYVFGRAQDYSFSLPDPRFIVAQRHHLRIWKTDRLVNGAPLWVAAATHDISIEFVKRKFRFFHRIDPNVDAEREFIAGNLAETRQLLREEYLANPAPVFRAQTENGQPYFSDSKMLLLELHHETTPAAVGTQVAAKTPVKETGATQADTTPEK